MESLLAALTRERLFLAFGGDGEELPQNRTSRVRFPEVEPRCESRDKGRDFDLRICILVEPQRICTRLVEGREARTLNRYKGRVVRGRSLPVRSFRTG